MTRKEAIKRLKEIDIRDALQEDYDALYMAIKALEQEPCEDCQYKEWLKGEVEQVPKTGHCKNCKYFEYDSVAKVDGIPLIVAHEICSRWGDGCKTNENGFCFLFEPKAESEG